jgi:hypothetical protein
VKKSSAAAAVVEAPRALTPADQLGHLLWMLEDVAPERASRAALALCNASYVVVRYLMGQRKESEAFEALAGARELVAQAKRGQALEGARP